MRITGVEMSSVLKYQDPKQADTIMRVQQELDETKIVLQGILSDYEQAELVLHRYVRDDQFFTGQWEERRNKREVDIWEEAQRIVAVQHQNSHPLHRVASARFRSSISNSTSTASEPSPLVIIGFGDIHTLMSQLEMFSGETCFKTKSNLANNGGSSATH
ncbi:hypothetical protein C8J56DRAFT_889102 [Mycena floridula]|nr:hypothetical protein C8J56DRAFT_889102 [Mycena floridula]